MAKNQRNELNELKNAKEQLKETLKQNASGNSNINGIMEVDLTDEELKRFWESYLKVKENSAGESRLSDLQKAEKALKDTLSKKQLDRERL